jgi:hypothetical protein
LSRITAAIPAVVVVLLAASASPVATELPPNLARSLTFYAPFDGSAEAAFAGGSKAPVTLHDVSFEKGVHGQGMYVGKDASCAYETAGNLSNAEGTLSMWLIPRGWIGGDSPYVGFFESRKDDANSSVVFKQSNYNGYFQALTEGEVNYCGLGVGDWLDGEPLHLVCTWGASGRSTYVDGELCGQSANPVSAFGTTFTVGCSTNWPSHAIVDEVHVFDRALTAGEVVELFKATEPDNWKPEDGAR